MIPLKMRRLFFGFTPRRLLGINGSILAHCPSLNQNKFARICWPPIRLTNPLNLNMVNWVLTLRHRKCAELRRRTAVRLAVPIQRRAAFRSAPCRYFFEGLFLKACPVCDSRTRGIAAAEPSGSGGEVDRSASRDFFR